MNSLESIYAQKADQYSKEAKEIKSRLTLITLFRLAGFILLVVSIYYFIKESQPILLVAIAFFSILFLLLVKIYFNLKDKKALKEKLLFINENELGILQGSTNQFGSGENHQSHESYLEDLDVFGKGSLFHLLNRTTTSHGDAKLAAQLSHPLLQNQSILQHQQAIKALATEIDTRQLLTAHGLLNNEKDGNLHSIVDWLQTPIKLLKSPWLKIIRWILPLFNLGALLYYLQTDHYLALSLGIIASWAITGSMAMHINHQHKQVGEKQKILNQYADILKIFSSANITHSELLEQLGQDAKQASQSINKLSQLSSFFDQRLNVVANILLNSFILYDIQCVLELEKWKLKNKNDFEKYIDCVGKIESLNSLSCFAFNHPGYAYPELAEDGLKMQASQMAHPLIPEKESVPNDFSIGVQEKLQLVTGSNMSGKTTFLRTVGINLLLAQCGMPVCASRFSFTPMDILSSIRVSDSLLDHTSYFMAELKRLQQIIVQLESGRPALVLVDEILRGTNSEDKTHGSEQFIRKLLQYHCLTLFATHDLSLGEMSVALPEKISNYCFESLIQNGELHFDFKLQSGVAKNKNASFLMQKMGII